MANRTAKLARVQQLLLPTLCALLWEAWLGMAGETENIRESSSVITWSTEYNLDSFLEISPHSLVQAVSPVVHLNKARCSKSVFEIHLKLTESE